MTEKTKATTTRFVMPMSPLGDLSGWNSDTEAAGPTTSATATSSPLFVLEHTKAQIEAQLVEVGVAIVDTRTVAAANTTHEAFLNQLVHQMGTPIRVFDTFPFWKPIGVDVTRPLDRSGGVGDQPLHMDFVNAEFPPDVIVLHCVRPDPQGGGYSRYADFQAAVEMLSGRSRRALAERVFVDGRVRNLRHVGHDINPFAVLGSKTGDRRFRYTGNLLTIEVPTEQRNALNELSEILADLERQVRLEAGQTLFIDNRRAVHSRGHLGSGQANLPAEQLRLLVQGFIKMGSDS